MASENASSSLSEADEDEAKRIMRGGYEMEQSENLPIATKSNGDDNTGVPGISVIQGLVKASFFHDLFCKAAYARYAHEKPQDRVAAMIARHPYFYGLCRYSDYFYRFIAATAVLGSLIAIVGGTILRIFYPGLLDGA